MRKIELVTAVAVVVFWTYQAAHAQCDNCPTPHVVIYGVKMKVPIPPADSAGFYTTASSQQALTNWVSLDTLVGVMGSVMTNDPDKGCVSWTEGALSYQMRALPDSLAGVELEGDTVSDLPPSGKVKGVEYLVWGELDSSGGKYHFHVYLEDGYSRDRIASGEADFTKVSQADSAANKAVSAIEPVFGQIRVYQLALRDSIPDMALKPDITVSPSQTDLSGNQTIPVTFQVKDCDGSPLKNVSLTIGATQGNFDNSTVTTDANGQATANYTANNVTAVGTLTAFYYPYITPTRKQKSASGSAIVYINNPNTKVWEMNVTGNHSFRDHVVGIVPDYVTGVPYVDYYYDDNVGENEIIREYIAATITDSSIVTTNVYSAYGDINLDQTVKSYSTQPGGYSTLSAFTTGLTAKGLDFGTSLIRLDGWTLPGSQPTFNFISEGNVDEITERETTSEDNSGMHQTDTTMTDSGVVDNYPSTFPTYPPNPHVTSSFSGNAGGYTFTGNYSFDTTDAPTPSETETISFEAHVTVSITPYKNLTAVRPSAANEPRDFELFPNYPNPFNPTTTIVFGLKENSRVTLSIYNVLGEKVEQWDGGMMNAGTYSRIVNMSRFASGVYLYRIEAIGINGDRFISVRKMLELK